MSKKKRSRRPPVATTVAPGSAAQIADANDVSAADVPAFGETAADETAAVDAGAMPAQAVDAAHVDEALEPAVSTRHNAPAPKAPPQPSAAARPSPSPTALPTWSGHEAGDIRGVLIQVAGGRLLLPNATIAEVLSYAEPESEGSDANWLLGRMRWRGWQLPLVAFSQLAGIGEEKPGLGSKVIVLKALGGDRRIPFFALVTQGFPRLVTVSRSALSVEDADGPLPTGVQALLRLNDEPALLPDLMQIEQCLRA